MLLLLANDEHGTTRLKFVNQFILILSLRLLTFVYFAIISLYYNIFITSFSYEWPIFLSEFIFMKQWIGTLVHIIKQFYLLITNLIMLVICRISKCIIFAYNCVVVFLIHIILLHAILFDECGICFVYQIWWIRLVSRIRHYHVIAVKKFIFFKPFHIGLGVMFDLRIFIIILVSK